MTSVGVSAIIDITFGVAVIFYHVTYVFVIDCGRKIQPPYIQRIRHGSILGHLRLELRVADADQQGVG